MGLTMTNTETTVILDAILKFADTLDCKKGACLIRAGEPAQCFYYIEEGTFEVSYEAQQTHIVVALIGAGNFFGEIGYFDRQPRTRTVTAATEARLRIFDRQVMESILAHDHRAHAQFMEHLLRLVCHRFWQVLSDRGPLSAYAASLSTGREHFQGLQALPPGLLASDQWLQVNTQIEDFKASLFDLSYRLQRDSDEAIPADLVREGERLLTDFNRRLRLFDRSGLPPEHSEMMWGYVFKELFPYFMRSRFAERAYYKPKGYAGDFMMMELIYRQDPEGDGKLGQLIDGWLLKQAPAQAVRNRRRLLVRLLDHLFRTTLAHQGVVSLINMACGPARELFDVLTACDYSHRIKALCIDIDADALKYANRSVNTAAHQADVRFMRENIVKWALGRAKHDLGLQDIVYSSGLCDYLDHRLMLRLIRRCHDQLKPGGTLILGNFSPNNPDRPFMDNMLYWRLIHRSEQELLDLFKETAFGDNVRFESEDQGVNVFAIAVKSG
jgi:extracellular factor (EF) 3-hydroxypalmitic acid methyl ester biosynthesis protein